MLADAALRSSSALLFHERRSGTFMRSHMAPIHRMAIFVMIGAVSVALLARADEVLARIESAKRLRRSLQGFGAFVSQLDPRISPSGELEVALRTAVRSGSALFAVPARLMITCADQLAQGDRVQIAKAADSQVQFCKGILANMLAIERCKHDADSEQRPLDRFLRTLPNWLGGQMEFAEGNIELLQPWQVIVDQYYLILQMASTQTARAACGSLEGAKTAFRWAYSMVNSRAFDLGTMNVRPRCEDPSSVLGSDNAVGIEAQYACYRPSLAQEESALRAVAAWRECEPARETGEAIADGEVRLASTTRPLWCDWVTAPPSLAMVPLLDLMDHGLGGIYEGDIQLGRVPVRDERYFDPPAGFVQMYDPKLGWGRQVGAVEPGRKLKELTIFATAKRDMQAGSPLRLKYADGACAQEVAVQYKFVPAYEDRNSNISGDVSSGAVYGCLAIQLPTEGLSQASLSKLNGLPGVVRVYTDNHTSDIENGVAMFMVLQSKRASNDDVRALLTAAKVASRSGSGGQNAKSGQNQSAANALALQWIDETAANMEADCSGNHRASGLRAKLDDASVAALCQYTAHAHATWRALILAAPAASSRSKQSPRRRRRYRD